MIGATRAGLTWSSEKRHVLPFLALFCLYFYWANVSAATFNSYAHYDPEFDYLVASLAPFKGLPYAYVDHPGTPVELLGTAFYAMTYPFIGRTGGAFVQYHFRHPELFLTIAHTFLVVASLLCAFYFYLTAASSETVGLPVALALALMFYSLDFSTIGTMTYWSHAAFNFPFGTLFLLVLVRVIRRSAGELGYRTLVGLGLGAGILTSIVLYLSAWVLGAAITVAVFYRLKGIPWAKTVRAGVLVLLGAAAGFFLSIIPIIWKWSAFWRWVLKLAFHQGRFGNGEPGLFSLSGSLTNLIGFSRQLPILFVAMGTIAALLGFAAIRSRRHLDDSAADWSLAVGLLVQTLFLLVIITKSAFFFYLLAVEATVPVLALVLVSLLRARRHLQRAVAWLVVIGVFWGVSTFFRQNVTLQLTSRAWARQEHARILGAIRRLARSRGKRSDELRILWGYGIHEQCNALLHGNARSGYAFDAELAQVCPDQFVIPHGSKSLVIDGRRVPIERVMDSSTAIIIRNVNADYLRDLAPDATVDVIQAPAGPRDRGSILVIHR